MDMTASCRVGFKIGEQKGGVKLSVVNQVSKEAVLTILEAGDVFHGGG